MFDSTRRLTSVAIAAAALLSGGASAQLVCATVEGAGDPPAFYAWSEA